jgi:sulfonate transport system substrate-binding protein
MTALASPHHVAASRRWRRFLPLAAAAAGSVVIAACGSSTAPSGPAGSGASVPASNSAATSVSDTTPAVKAAAPAASTAGVTLRIGDQAGTGAQALLDASGLIKKIPFKVSFSDFTSGPPMLQALSAGDLDVGGVGDAPPVFSAAGNAKLAIVGALRNGPNNAALLVPKGSPIHSISQLKGKRIAVSQGSSADYHLLTVLTKAGLTVHDATLDYLQPAAAIAAFSSGSVDAWDVWSPFIEQAEIEKGARVLVNGQGYGSNYSYEVASTDALQDSKTVAALDEYLKVLDEAHVWANTHPAAWAAIWAKSTGLPTNVMDKAAQDDTQTPVAVTPAIVAAEQSLVKGFYSAGLIPRSFSFANYASSSLNGTVG